MTATDNWDRLFDGPPIIDSDDEAVRERRAAAPGGRASSGYKRLDIQGLRAFAVLLVVLDHLGSWPHGGFVGVDVFFVISGFLITGLLLKAAGSGSAGHYFAHFYQRRIRRILPAAIAVLIACWIAAGLTFKGERVGQTHTDVWWALGFSANIHFARIGTDYFQDNRSQSLVQHFWSLAVEEQFYVVWPIVVFIVIGLLSRRRPWGRGLLLVVISVATVLSFAWAIHQTATDPNGAYFSTVSRAWELGVGAVLAVLIARYPEIGDRLGRRRGPLMLLGLVGIIVGATVIKASPGFPAPWAALPVLSTAIVIFAGTSTTSETGGRWASPLTNPVSGYVGEISYSVYLWHWPTIIIVQALIPDRDSAYYVVVLTAMAALSVFSYHFIEAPFRTSRAARRAEGPNAGPSRGHILLAPMMLGVIALTAYSVRPAPPVPHFVDASPSAITSQILTEPGLSVPPAALTKAIDAALNARSFPDLTPGIDQIGLSAGEHDWLPCNSFTTVPDTCIFKPASGTVDPAKVALVVGDSISLSWLPAVESALVPHGWTVYGFARGECPAADVAQGASVIGATTNRLCNAHHAALATVINSVRPSLVVLSSTELTLQNLAKRDSSAASAYAAYQRGMVKTERIAASSATTRVVTLSPPPFEKSLLDCDTAGATPSDCVASISTLWDNQAAADIAAARTTHTTYVNDHLWFCSDNAYCPAFIKHVPVMYDGEHMSKAYAQTLAPEMEKALLG